jgi:hypothetical protein
MSFPYSPNLAHAKIESLHTQHDFLNLLRLRHLQWSHAVDQPGIQELHAEIVELLEHLVDDYDDLLQVLDSGQDGG